MIITLLLDLVNILSIFYEFLYSIQMLYKKDILSTHAG